MKGYISSYLPVIQLCLWILFFIACVHLHMKFNKLAKLDSACLTRVRGKRIANEILTDIPTINERFQNLLDRKLVASDPEVIEMARMLLHPPSGHVIKPSIPYPQLMREFQTNQSRWVREQFEDQHAGRFFVECGALDGERSSNTIVLEQEYKWQGLLIEADPFYFTQLLGKSRRSWAINACLSASRDIGWLSLSEDAGGRGTMLLDDQTPDDLNIARPEWNPIVQSNFPVIRQIPCFPLESLLLALNRTVVDYFSLDVEGMEMSVLNSIPHYDIHIRTMTVEYDHATDTEQEAHNMRRTIEEMGYEFVKTIDVKEPKRAYWANDFVFVKR